MEIPKLKDDAEKIPAWLREGATEIEGAHAVLDGAGVPRDNNGTPLTLAARIAVALQKRP